MAYIAKFFRNGLEKFLEQFVPLHAKRIIFLVALYRASCKGELTNEELEELNAALVLAKTDISALYLPMLIAESVGVKYEKSIANCDDKELEGIVMRTPQWLHYGRTSDLMRDLNLLQRFAITHAA